MDKLCRSHVAQIQSVQREQQEQRSQELARAVAEATFKQLEAQIESDWAVLRAQMGSCEDQAVQTAKDLKYVRDRQQNHVKNQTKSTLFIYFDDSRSVAALQPILIRKCHATTKYLKHISDQGRAKSMWRSGCRRSVTWSVCLMTKTTTGCCRSSWRSLSIFGAFPGTCDLWAFG